MQNGGMGGGVVGVGGMVQGMGGEDQNIVVKNVLVNAADTQITASVQILNSASANARQMVQWSVRCLP